MNKKGFFFALPFLIGLGIFIILFLILLIIFGVRISEGIVAMVDLISSVWPWLVAIIILVLFRMQARAILNAILGIFGVRV